MRPIRLILITLALAGCSRSALDYIHAEQDYQCTVPQMKKAQDETLFCKAHTAHDPAFCFGSAIMRNCEPRRGKS